MDRRGYFMLINKRDKYHYLAFTNLEDREIILTVKKNNANAPTVKFYYSDSEYSKGMYAETSTDGVTLPVPAGGVLYIRGVGNAAWATMTNDATVAGYNTIGCSGRYAVSGNMLSLLDAHNVSSGRMSADAALACIFSALGEPTNATNLIDASELVLPSVLRTNCFRDMFNGCAALEAMPDIPVTEVANYAMYAMFQNCTSLTTAPKLELDFGNNANYACARMFNGCTSLVSVGSGSVFRSAWTSTPTNTNVQAMDRMFNGCTSLLHGVDLDMPAVYRGWCVMMYQGCTSLQSVPRLSSRTDNILIGYQQAFARAFYGCTSLTSVGAHYIFYGNGFGEMFMGCTGLTSLPQGTRLYGNAERGNFYDTPTSQVHLGAKQSMFKGCTNLVDASGMRIECVAGNINNTGCLQTFAEIFSGCTNLTGAPDLSGVTAMSNGNYNSSQMFHQAFYGCTSLVVPPALPPVANVGNNAYQDMFYGCTKLASVPSMEHVTGVAPNAMRQMFYGCTSLTAAADLDSITTFRNTCFMSMYYGCNKIAAAPALPVATNVYHIMENMFYNCTGMKGVVHYTCRGEVALAAFFNTRVTGVVANNTTAIGERAFGANSALKDIDVTRFYISDWFTGNPAAPTYPFTLDSLTIRGDYAPASINTTFINALAATCPIKVHANRVDEYKAAAVWSSRAAYISAIE